MLSGKATVTAAACGHPGLVHDRAQFMNGGMHRMTCRLVAVCFDAHDPPRLARFWAELPNWEMTDEPTGAAGLRGDDDTGFDIRFNPTPRPKTAQNQQHFDLTSASLEHQQQTVARALGLGARH